MSKKMMKRGLALGALMAFVITGSAMAAEDSATFAQVKTTTNSQVISNVDDDTYGDKTKDLSYIAATQTICTAADNTSITLSGNSLKIIASENNENYERDAVLTTYGTSNSTITLTAKENIDIKGLIIGNGTTNTIKLNAGTNINVEGAIKTYSGANNITLEAGSVYVKPLKGEDAIKTHSAESSITLKGTNVTEVNGHIIIDSGATGSSIIVGEGGNTTINGDVKTWGDESSIKVTGTNNTTINGTVHAWGRQDTPQATTINVTVLGENITINAKNQQYGVFAYGDFWNTKENYDDVEIVLGDANTNIVNINDFNECGILADYEGTAVKVNAANLNIVSPNGKDGICVANGTYNGNWGDQNTGNNAQVRIGKNTVTTIEVANNAIVAMSEGIVDIKGDLTATAENAVLTRGNATININSDDKGASLGSNVVLNGDIAFDSSTPSNTPVNAYININLDGEDSSWTGSTTMYKDDAEITDITMDGNGNFVGEGDTTDNLKVSNFTLGLSNSATWTVTEQGFVNEVTGNGGNIVLKTQEGSTSENVKVASVAIGTNSNTDLTVSGDETLTQAIEDGEVTAEAALKAVADSVTVKEAEEEVTIATAEGDIAGAYSATLGTDGALTNLTKAVAQKNENISDATMNLKAHWRAHMNDMNKRMGDLRMANGETGVWTRMVRGESEYDGSKVQYNQYQLGYDEKLSVDKRWTVGAAVTFSEGDGSYGSGTTDDKSTAFAIYGSKLNNDGTFVDLIARYARVESDLEDVHSGNGDYSTNGYSVSAEFGKRIEQTNGLWVEPQVELTYGTIDSVDFTLSKGKEVHVDSMDSLVARLGLSIGKDIKQGNVYARASYLYDFDGESETSFSRGAVQGDVVKEDFGGGWWEVGVGANINLSKATYIYADVEKTFGGEVDTNWQWNLGVRYSF